MSLISEKPRFKGKKFLLGIIRNKFLSVRVTPIYGRRFWNKMQTDLITPVGHKSLRYIVGNWTCISAVKLKTVPKFLAKNSVSG